MNILRYHACAVAFLALTVAGAHAQQTITIPVEVPERTAEVTVPGQTLEIRVVISGMERVFEVTVPGHTSTVTFPAEAIEVDVDVEIIIDGAKPGPGNGDPGPGNGDPGPGNGAAQPADLCDGQMCVGVNLAGFEFTPQQVPGNPNQHFPIIQPNMIDAWADRGANIIRLPFLIERMISGRGGQLTGLWTHVDAIANHARQRKVSLILDAHNYFRWNGQLIGLGNGATFAEFADLWRQIAERYKDNPYVHFELMNEPHGVGGEHVVDVYNAAIKAIRATGAQNWIHAGGTGWSSAFQWNDSNNRNHTAFLNLKDPLNRTLAHAHQYTTNSNFEGEPRACDAANANRLDFITGWARTNGFKVFLGEFNALNNAACMNVLRAWVDKMKANRDVWAGGTGWADGPWWPDNYDFVLRPGSQRANIIMDLAN
jgi:endoglucanase